MQQHNMRKPWLLILILFGSLLPLGVASGDSEDPTFTLTGQVYTSEGEPAGSTYVRVDTMESVLSVDGSYSFPGIVPGEHTVRAYFMNDGHTVAYRNIFIEQDTTLDWYEGHNWITVAAVNNTGQTLSQEESYTVTLTETAETQDLDDGRTEFGPYRTGDYYTISTHLDGGESNQLTTHLKLEPGSATAPHVNHVVFQEGKNSVFGFVTDAAGNPAPEVIVSGGDVESTTNPDGFYLLNGLSIGQDVELEFIQSGHSIAPNVSVSIDYGSLWVNQTTTTTLELPGNATFLNSVMSVPMGPVELEWTKGLYTDYVELYVNEISQSNIIYRGSSSSFEYTPSESGTSEFFLVAYNVNGTNPHPGSVLVLFLPTQSEEGSWTTGMSWNYSLVHTPEYRSNRTLTAIGTEEIVDAFDRSQSTYLLRITDDRYEDGETAFRWVSSETYLPVKTYWSDAPESSGYYQEGSLGWNFTSNGSDAGLFDGQLSTRLHFNRTNIIGVPGHPNGYDDTHNSVSVQHGVSVTTPAGVFNCTYISIEDDEDGVLSWELWFNSTVQNYVKIIDRLPGSHSDTVVHELTDYSRPNVPTFLTEAVVQSSPTFELQWSEFSNIKGYQLLENGVEVYRGTSTEFEVRNRGDGTYQYQINAITELDYVLMGAVLEIQVDFAPPVPVLTSSASFLSTSETALFSWEYEYEVDHYSLTVQSPDGTTREVYNGSSSFAEVDELEPGLHRFRLTASVNDKLSEPSSSVFVTVETDSSSNNDGFMPYLSALSVMFVLLSAILLIEMGRAKE